MAATKKCIVCGKKYEYCPHCSANNRKDSWKSIYCSSTCRDIFDTCSVYEGNKLTQEEAYNKLVGLNIASINPLKSVKASVDKIMSYKKIETPDIPVIEEETNTDDSQQMPKRLRRNRSFKSFDEE